MRLGFILGEIWTGLRRNLSMAISVILVTMVSVFLLGLGMLAQRTLLAEFDVEAYLDSAATMLDATAGA